VAQRSASLACLADRLPNMRELRSCATARRDARPRGAACRRRCLRCQECPAVLVGPFISFHAHGLPRRFWLMPPRGKQNYANTHAKSRARPAAVRSRTPSRQWDAIRPLQRAHAQLAPCTKCMNVRDLSMMSSLIREGGILTNNCLVARVVFPVLVGLPWRLELHVQPRQYTIQLTGACWLRP